MYIDTCMYTHRIRINEHTHGLCIVNDKLLEIMEAEKLKKLTCFTDYLCKAVSTFFLFIIIIVVDSWILFPPDIVDISSLQAFILIIVSQFQEHFISEEVLATHAVTSVLKI